MTVYDGRGPRRQAPTLDGTFEKEVAGRMQTGVFFFLLSILSLGSPKLPRALPRAPALIRAGGFQGGGWGTWGGGDRQG